MWRYLLIYFPCEAKTWANYSACSGDLCLKINRITAKINKRNSNVLFGLKCCINGTLCHVSKVNTIFAFSRILLISLLGLLFDRLGLNAEFDSTSIDDTSRWLLNQGSSSQPVVLMQTPSALNLGRVGCNVTEKKWSVAAFVWHGISFSNPSSEMNRVRENANLVLTLLTWHR